MIIAAPPFAALAAAVAFALTFAATRRRSGGVDFFDLRLGASPRRWSASLIAALLIAPLLQDIAFSIHDAAVMRTWIESCAGQAAPIEVAMRRPALQVSPLVQAALIFWILHLRAYAISPPRR